MQGAVEARNANYAAICRQLNFTRRAWFGEEDDAAATAMLSAGSTHRKTCGYNLPADVLAGAAAADSDGTSEVVVVVGVHCARHTAQHIWGCQKCLYAQLVLAADE